jgi:hypothetical protein
MSHRVRKAAMHPLAFFAVLALTSAQAAWCADSVQARVNAGFQMNLSGTAADYSCSASYKVPGGKRLHIDYISYNVVSGAVGALSGGTITVASPQFTTYFATLTGYLGSYFGTGAAEPVMQGGQVIDVVADAGATINISIVFYHPDSSATCSFGIAGQLVDTRDWRQDADGDSRH